MGFHEEIGKIAHGLFRIHGLFVATLCADLMFHFMLMFASYHLKNKARLFLSTTPRNIYKIDCLTVQESSATVAIISTYARHTLQ